MPSATVAKRKKKKPPPRELAKDLVLSVVGPRDTPIEDAIVGGELERTIEGASTLTLELHDPHRRIVRHPDLSTAVDIRFAGNWWRLCKVQKSADTITLTFEDRAVAYLRTHKRARKVSRGKSTRAEFVGSMVREVKKHKIVFVCPELHQRQKIGKPPSEDEDTRDDERGAGIDADADLTVKGARATREQRRNGQKVLDVAAAKDAGPKATKALMEAVIVESLVKNLTGGDASSVGILQLLDIHGSVAKRRDIARVCGLFLDKGFTGRGGAIELAKKHNGWTAGQVAQACQGSAHPERYDQVGDEAAKWIAAYGGPGGGDTGGTSGRGGKLKAFEFRRGEPGGKAEDSWTAIQRLAEEVNWRAWCDRGRLYYMSEDRIMKSRARYRISEDDDGVHWIDFDVDSGKVSAELTVSARADLYDVPIGCVVRVEKLGIANGRYLVTAVRRGLFDADTTITLRAKSPKFPEPPAERREPKPKDEDADDGTDSTTGADASTLVGWARSQLGVAEGGSKQVKWAKALGYSPSLPWCSIFVATGLKAVEDLTITDLPPNPAYSGAWLNWSGAGRVSKDKMEPGDIVVFDWGDGGMTDHVAIYEGGGNVIGGNQGNKVSRVPLNKGAVVGVARFGKRRKKPPAPAIKQHFGGYRTD